MKFQLSSLVSVTGRLIPAAGRLLGLAALGFGVLATQTSFPSAARTAPILELPAGATWVATAPQGEEFSRAIQDFLAQASRSSHRLRPAVVEQEFIRHTGLPLNNAGKLKAAGVDVQAPWTLFKLQERRYLAVEVSSQKKLQKALDRWVRSRHLAYREDKRLSASGWLGKGGIVSTFSRSEGARVAAGYAISGRHAVVLIDHWGNPAELEQALLAIQSAAPVRPSVHAPLMVYLPKAAWVKELWLGVEFHREGIDAKGSFRGLREKLFSPPLAAASGGRAFPGELLPLRSPGVSSELSGNPRQHWHPPMAALGQGSGGHSAGLSQPVSLGENRHWLLAPAAEVEGPAPLLWLRMLAGEGAQDLLVSALAEGINGADESTGATSAQRVALLRSEGTRGNWELLLPQLDLKALEPAPIGLGPGQGAKYMWATTLRMGKSGDGQVPGLRQPSAARGWGLSLGQERSGELFLTSTPTPANSPNVSVKDPILSCPIGYPIAAARLEPRRLSEQLGGVKLLSSMGNPVLMGLYGINSEFGTLLKTAAPVLAIGCQEQGERVRFQARWRLAREGS